MVRWWSLLQGKSKNSKVDRENKYHKTLS